MAIPPGEERSAGLMFEIATIQIVGNAAGDEPLFDRCHEIAADETVAMDVRAAAVRKIDEAMDAVPSCGYPSDEDLVRSYLADHDEDEDTSDTFRIEPPKHGEWEASQQLMLELKRAAELTHKLIDEFTRYSNTATDMPRTVDWTYVGNIEHANEVLNDLCEFLDIS